MILSPFECTKKDALIWGSLWTAGCVIAVASTPHALLLGTALALNVVLTCALLPYDEQAMPSHREVFNREMLNILGYGGLYALCSWASPIVLVLGKLNGWAAGMALAKTLFSVTSGIWAVAQWIDPAILMVMSLLMAGKLGICVVVYAKARVYWPVPFCRQEFEPQDVGVEEAFQGPRLDSEEEAALPRGDLSAASRVIESVRVVSRTQNGAF